MGISGRNLAQAIPFTPPGSGINSLQAAVTELWLRSESGEAADVAIASHKTETSAHSLNNISGLQTALDGKLSVGEKGVVEGIATLGSSGRITISQLPVPTVVSSSSTLGSGSYELNSSSGIFNITLAPGSGEWIFTNSNKSASTNIVRITAAESPTFTASSGTQVTGDLIIDNGGVEVNIKNIDNSNNYYVTVNGMGYFANPLPFIIGDFKYGYQSVDHIGWIRLNGRLKNTLTTTQQVAASSLGIGVNLPNAADRAIVGVSGTKALNSTGGSGTRAIAQTNLPNVNFLGNSSTNGNHNHAVTMVYHSQTQGGFNGGRIQLVDRQFNTVTNPGEITLAASGDHNHTLTVSSGGSGSALDIQNPYLALNAFIYLGN